MLGPSFVTLRLLGTSPSCQETTEMSIDIALNIKLSLEEGALEDALAEFDELTVSELVTQVLDKAIALDDIKVEVLEGPNSLDEFDEQTA